MTKPLSSADLLALYEGERDEMRAGKRDTLSAAAYAGLLLRLHGARSALQVYESLPTEQQRRYPCWRLLSEALALEEAP